MHNYTIYSNKAHTKLIVNFLNILCAVIIVATSVMAKPLDSNLPKFSAIHSKMALKQLTTKLLTLDTSNAQIDIKIVVLVYNLIMLTSHFEYCGSLI